ncbi:nucleotidyl transferase AbiEii/AbiGii toxin family protein [Bacteroides sp.]|uniref:nucleotidyl transferase AbiEii/AbiGii toxin family protein n=1 Tax=Bacteroides sp. TaxID=29523 RepID=UPI0025BE78FD|nr:nucleotidyl transferase AbiEii/AbiGii toxin family protein [Bacteroides sp.]
MLSYKTVEPHTLELLKRLTQEPFLAETRLVGGTTLALQYGHRMSIDLDFFGNIEDDNIAIREILNILLQHYTLEEILSFYAKKYPENSLFRALMSLTYFEDAEEQLMPKMFSNIEWKDMKQLILKKVAASSPK